jgi:cytochrome c nitrite reductase small subunit
MRAQYDACLKSSHRMVATCNDCHTPHNIFGKYALKANNGFWHSFYFTTGWYPDTIEITKSPRTPAGTATRTSKPPSTEMWWHSQARGLECTRCHASVGHSEAAASLPHTTLVGSNPE